MSQHDPGKLAKKYIDKDKWWDILSKMIEVLRVNIFIVDASGSLILPPEEGKYGGGFLTDPVLKFDFLQDSVDINSFDMYGTYLEKSSRYDGLNIFAVPLRVEKADIIIAYMVVGPVIISKKESARDYEKMAKICNVDPEALLNEVNDIRVVSNVMMKSILDLVYEVAENNVKLKVKEQRLSEYANVFDRELNRAEKDIYSAVNQDELLVSFLDVALKLTETECGSIMVVDKNKKDLVIKASKGLDEEKVQNVRARVGEGIAGIAANDRETFVIRGKSCDNRISHLLNRPDISESIVMPLVVKDGVFGVLNLHTKKVENKISENFDKLQYLSELLSLAI